MVVVNAEKNKELLSDVPYQLKEDLALIYKVKLETNNEEMVTASDTFMIHFNMIIYGKYQMYGKIDIIYP